MLLSQIDGHKKDNKNSIEKLFLTENDVSSSCHQRWTKKNSELPMRNQPPNLNFVYLRFESSEGLDILVCCLTILKDFKASLLQNTMLWTFPHQLSRSSSLYNCSLSFELTLSAVISLCRVFPISRKVGLASGSCCQHCHMMAYLQQREHLLSKY